MKWALALVCIGLGVLTVWCSRPPPLLDAAQLVANPGRYAGRMVRIDGYWRSGFECSQLVISNTPLGRTVWVTADLHSISNHSPEALRFIMEDSSTRERRGRFQLTTVHFRGTGYFESALPGRIDRMLTWAESSLGITALSRFRSPIRAFGHLGSSPSQLTLQALELYQVQNPMDEPAILMNR